MKHLNIRQLLSIRHTTTDVWQQVSHYQCPCSPDDRIIMHNKINLKYLYFNWKNYNDE
jgi:hypothetical protein